MNAIVEFIMRHGYAVLFGALFAHQIGLPVPGPLFLLAAGALAATGKLGLAAALCLAVIACVLADWLWYEAGRLRGDKVLHLIHRFAPDPAAADRRARKTFAQYGPPILVLCKFVPGLDAVAPPLAGTSGTSRLRFLTLETTGACLYSGVYAGLGITSGPTWSVWLPTRAERVHSWADCCSASSLFTVSASWFRGIALYATLNLRETHQ